MTMNSEWAAILALLFGCLAISGGLLRAPWRQMAAWASVGLATSITVWLLATALGDSSPPPPRMIHWLAWLLTLGAVWQAIWDVQFPRAGLLLYVLLIDAWIMSLAAREFQPPVFLLWAAVCEWAAFVLLAALVGWLTRIEAVAQVLRLPASRRAARLPWFVAAQWLMLLGAATLVAWIALDRRFDGLGEDIALLGLAGRRAACPAALMLLGGAILMAWQCSGRWQAAWQYASLGAGLLFTTSIGWSGIEPVAAALQASAWRPQAATLAITAGMMTMMSGWGLAQGLPTGSEWIARARRAMPFFATLSATMTTVSLLAA